MGGRVSVKFCVLIFENKWKFVKISREEPKIIFDAGTEKELKDEKDSLFSCRARLGGNPPTSSQSCGLSRGWFSTYSAIFNKLVVCLPSSCSPGF